MSAYQYPAAPPGAPAATTPDPTAVFGRRSAAIVVDFLLYLLIMSFVGPTPLSPLAEYYEDVPAGVDACEVLRDNEDAVGCLQIGDRVYFTDGGDAAIQIVVWLAVVAAYVLVQGATGRTPGKAIFGLKAVDEQGATPGFGKSLLRTVLWIVDAAPWCIPGLVAFIVGLSSKGHRRVGDMAAKTFVVGKGHTGPVVVPGLATATPYGAPAGAPGPGGPWAPAPGAPGSPWNAPPAQGAPPAQPSPPSGWGAPQPGPYPPPGAQGQPAPGAWSAPGGWPPPSTAGESEASDAWRGTPGAGAPESAGQEPEPSSPGGDAPGSAGVEPTAGGADAGTPGAGTAGAAAGAASPPGYDPQWDAARGTYIVWEPQRQQWLGWDDAAKEWRPL